MIVFRSKGDGRREYYVIVPQMIECETEDRKEYGHNRYASCRFFITRLISISRNLSGSLDKKIYSNAKVQIKNTPRF